MLGHQAEGGGEEGQHEAQVPRQANARGVPVDSGCLTKAEQKFSQTWQRIEAAGGCRTSTLSEHDVESRIDALVFNLAVSLAPCRELEGVCGGTCPFGLNCFEIGTGCFGEPEPCRCHGSTTTCPTTSTVAQCELGDVSGYPCSPHHHVDDHDDRALNATRLSPDYTSPRRTAAPIRPASGTR